MAPRVQGAADRNKKIKVGVHQKYLDTNFAGREDQNLDVVGK